MKIAEVATDAEGTTSTTCLTSHSTEETTDKKGTTNTKYMSYHTTATEEVPTTAAVGNNAEGAK